MNRREFLKAVPATAYVLARPTESFSRSMPQSDVLIRLHPFDYRGVQLHGSRWLEQYRSARDLYLSVSNDDILKGYREFSGLSAPGRTLGGWCQKDSSTVFGQWLSGMARMYRATGDNAIRDKAVFLMAEFAKTVKPDGDCGMRHYPFDKLVCGLVDMHLYIGHPDAIPLLEKVTDWASRTLSRENIPATSKKLYYGRPQEWYTLSENLYRAFQATKDPRFKSFAEVWHYDHYWNKFADTAAPSNAHGLHAYSHVNTFSGAAMAYAVTGNPKYLRIIRNAYDYLQNTQCYATGGYGTTETLMSPNGGLGKVLEFRSDSFETSCGSWAGFKLSSYLMQFTGEARYGDWIERLFYNGIGAALPIAAGGKNFYYSDYRIAGGMKVYNWEAYTCCAGTYIQNVVDYHNLIYFNDDSGLYVNLYVPSEVSWVRSEGEVRLVQETRYPEEELSSMTLTMQATMNFALKFRIPGWASDISVKVNGIVIDTPCAPGTWGTISRIWTSGDRVEIRIPLPLRMQPVDQQHPNRVAVMRGPVVLVLEAAYHDSAFRLPEKDNDLSKWLVPDKTPGDFRVELPDGGRVVSKFRPFYAVEEGFPYKMYFDTNELPIVLIKD